MQPADLVPLLQNASLRRNIDYDDHTGTVSDNGISLKENRPNYSTHLGDLPVAKIQRISTWWRIFALDFL